MSTEEDYRRRIKKLNKRIKALKRQRRHLKRQLRHHDDGRRFPMEYEVR